MMLSEMSESMRTTVTIDDDLWAKAAELTGISGRSALIRDGLETLIRVESGCGLVGVSTVKESR